MCMTGISEGMTENEISKAIRELESLHRKGELTPALARELDEYKAARRMIRNAGRRRCW